MQPGASAVSSPKEQRLRWLKEREGWWYHNDRAAIVSVSHCLKDDLSCEKIGLPCCVVNASSFLIVCLMFVFRAFYCFQHHRVAYWWGVLFFVNVFFDFATSFSGFLRSTWGRNESQEAQQN